jgi:hypothetical protein
MIYPSSQIGGAVAAAVGVASAGYGIVEHHKKAEEEVCPIPLPLVSLIRHTTIFNRERHKTGRRIPGRKMLRPAPSNITMEVCAAWLRGSWSMERKSPVRLSSSDRSATGICTFAGHSMMFVVIPFITTIFINMHGVSFRVESVRYSIISTYSVNNTAYYRDRKSVSGLRKRWSHWIRA